MRYDTENDETHAGNAPKSRPGESPEPVKSDPVPVPSSAPNPQATTDGGAADSGDEILDDRGTFDDPVVAADTERADTDLNTDRMNVDREDLDLDTGREPGDDVTDGAAEDVMDDRGTFNPVVADERTDPDDLTAVSPDPERAGDRTAAPDRPEFHDPAPLPTTFGAATVSGAAAAAALANPDRTREYDPRDDRTAADEDGMAVDDRPAVDEFDTNDDGRRGGQPFGEAAPPGELMPGDVPAEPITALWSGGDAERLRERWRDVQLRFVDDPRAAAGEAQALVEDALGSFAAALAARKNELGGWQATESGDTEQLRMVVRRYRDLLDRLLGL